MLNKTCPSPTLWTSTADLFPPWKVIIKPYPLLHTPWSVSCPQKELASKPVAIYKRRNSQKFNSTLIIIKTWTLSKFFRKLHTDMVADREQSVSWMCQGKEGEREREKKSLWYVHSLFFFFWQWECHRNPLGDHEYYTEQEHYRWASTHCIDKNTVQYFTGTLKLINHSVKALV